MKTKTNLKFFLILGVILGAMLLFGTTKVQASTTVELDNKVMDWISDVTIREEDNFETGYYDKDGNWKIETLNGALFISINIKNTNYTLANYKATQQYLKNNNLTTLNQKVRISIPDNIKEVKDRQTNKIYKIINNNGNNYIEYDIEISKLFTDVNEIIEYYEHTNTSHILEYLTKDNKTETLYIDYGLNDPISLYRDIATYGSIIADKNGKYEVDKFGTTGEFGKGYAVSHYARYLRMGGWDDCNYPTETNKNYLNEYIYLTLPYNMGESITTKINGSNEKIKFEKIENINEYWCENSFVYRTQITQNLEKLLFSKPQTVKLIYEDYNKNFELPYTFNFLIEVKGTTRTNVNINDNNGVKIDFNGVLPMGVSVKSDNITEETELYTTLTTTGINDIKSYYNINTLTYLSLNNIYTVGGNINGAIQLTFDVGQQYNGKYVYILHTKHNKENEYFMEKVENGKVSIVVYELSPFMVAVENKVEDKPIEEEKPTTPPTENTDTTNKGEKDDTPKTGTLDIIYYVLGITAVAATGIIILKKNLK